MTTGATLVWKTITYRTLGPERAGMDELWGHCPKCDTWFLIEDPSIDALYLCPNDLMRADDFRPRVFERRHPEN